MNHTQTQRPAFLQQRFQNARAMIDAFRTLPTAEAEAVDAFLMKATGNGMSLSHEERYLYGWINEHEDLDAAFAQAEGGAA